MLVKNDLNMNNNGKNKEHITSQANKIIKFISTNIKAYNKTHNVFYIYFIVQDITFLMIMAVKCPSIVFLHSNILPIIKLTHLNINYTIYFCQ